MKPSTNEPIKEEKVAKPRDSNAVFNYNKDTEMFRQRVENFIQETNSVLSRPRNNSNNSLGKFIRVPKCWLVLRIYIVGIFRYAKSSNEFLIEQQCPPFADRKQYVWPARDHENQ